MKKIKGLLNCAVCLVGMILSTTHLVAAPDDRGLGAVVFSTSRYVAGQHQVHIEWQAQNEIEYQVQYYLVEQTTNGVSVNKVTVVEAVGTSTEIQNYAALHDSLTEGVNYYRVTAVNTNGDKTSTDWIMVNVENPNIQLYPSLLTSSDCVKIKGIEEGCVMQIYSSKGRISGDFSLQPGCNSLHLSEKSNGLYHYFVYKGDQLIKSGKFEIAGM